MDHKSIVYRTISTESCKQKPKNKKKKPPSRIARDRLRAALHRLRISVAETREIGIQTDPIEEIKEEARYNTKETQIV